MIKLSCTCMFIACISLLQLTSAQECEDTRSSFIFPRTFTIMFDGLPHITATRQMAATALGSCSSLLSLGEKMIRTFKDYNIPDLTRVRFNPYRAYDSSRFIINPLVRPPGYYSRIISSTLFDYSRYMDTPMHTFTWVLTAKTTIRGTSGRRKTLPANHHVVFGMFRFKMHGRQFCVEFTSRTPQTSTGTAGERFTPSDLLVKNMYLGEGAAIGLSIRSNNTLRGRIIMTFPDGPP